MARRKLLILTKKKSLYSVQQFVETGKAFFDQIDVRFYTDVRFDFTSKGIALSIKGQDIENYTHIISRTSDQYYELRYLIALKSKELGLKMLNDEAILKMPHYTKLFQSYRLAKNHISIPHTIYSPTENVQITGKHIIKGIRGRLGKQVSLIDGRGGDNGGYKLSTKVLLQESSDATSDFRLVVLGEKYMGAVKRSAKFSRRDFDSTAYEPSSKEVKLAISAAKSFSFDYVGVDIMQFNNEPCVLELNIDGGFKVFDRVNNTTIGKDIIDYLVKK